MFKNRNFSKNLPYPKSIKIILLIFLIMAACVNKRRPGLSDKELFAQQNDSAMQESEKVPDFSDMETYVIPPGIKFKESRVVDPAHPPIVLDIANRKLNIRKFNLSDYYTQVRYVKLKHPKSATEGNFLLDIRGGSIGFVDEKIRRFFNTMDIYSKFKFTDDYIIAGDACFGLHCYDKEGKFLYTIESNDYPKVYDASRVSISFNAPDLQGFYGKISVNGNNCLYCVKEDNETMLCFYDLTLKKRIMTRPIERRALILDHQSMADYVDEPVRAPEDFLLTFDLKGDTLCRFPNYNPIPVTKGGSYTSPPSPFIYYFNKQLTIQQTLNDTVYRVISPNRLIPVYVLNFGTYRADVQTYLFGNISEKLIPNTWKETDQYILFGYTQNIPSPLNKQNGSVQFFYSYFDKKSRQFYHFSEGTSIPFDQYFMENPIPDALPFMWSYAETEDHQFRVIYTKKRLEEISKNKEFASLSTEQQNKLKMLQNELEDNEVLIMILE